MDDPIARAPSPFTAMRQFARRATREATEQCDLCGEPIPAEHRHLLVLGTREVQCACRACSILFDAGGAGGGARRLIPTRTLALPDFDLPDELWEELRLPVSMAYFSYQSAAQRTAAFYPSPAGATESLLPLDAWAELERRNPILSQLEHDVEALLVNRVRGARDAYLVPIDACYTLVGLIRLHWRGISGGQEVWQAIDRFFGSLRERAKPVGGAHA